MGNERRYTGEQELRRGRRHGSQWSTCTFIKLLFFQNKSKRKCKNIFLFKKRATLGAPNEQKPHNRCDEGGKNN